MGKGAVAQKKKRERDVRVVHEGDDSFSGQSIKKSLRERDAVVLPLAKARLIGPAARSNTQTSNQISRDDEQAAFVEAGAIEPPYDPEMLCLLFEHSSALRQNVDAYATNIDGFGHSLAAVIDLDADDSNARVAAAILADTGKPPANDDAIQSKRKEIEALVIEEKAEAELFFDFCSQEISFITLRRRTRQDLEVMGNAYWEVLRDPETRKVTEFVYMPGFTVRLLQQDKYYTRVMSKIKVSDIDYEEVPRKRRFRRFVQVIENRVVYFKEFGDPRVMSSVTGMIFKSVEELEAAEPDASPATELLHFKIHSPRSAYGVPRWIGTLLAVLGSRQAEEVNFLYFENKSVPPMAVLVSGGRLSADSVTRLESYIENHIKGKKNFHKILVIEAEPAAGSDPNGVSKMRIQLVPLLGAQHSDGQFQTYIANNTDSVGGAFRLPRLLRGDIRDFNRSTADAALTFAEMQVFQPEREEFDFIFNRHILPELGFRSIKFRSNAPITRDPATMADMVRNLVNANVLTPEEGRSLCEDIFNRPFRKIKKAWAKQPMPMTLAGMGQIDEAPTNPPTWPQDAAVPPRGGRGDKALQKGVVGEALRLVALQKVMRHVETQLAIEMQSNARTQMLEEEVLVIPRDEYQRLTQQAA